MSQFNSNVMQVLDAIHQNFHAVGYSIRTAGNESVIHLPHLVSLPDFSRDEQREQVQMLVEIAIKSSGVAGTTFTLRDTTGREAGDPNWHQFHVEVRVPHG
jgi:hypothetical protein